MWPLGIEANIRSIFFKKHKFYNIIEIKYEIKMYEENNIINEESVENILNLLITEEILSYIPNDNVKILTEKRI